MSKEFNSTQWTFWRNMQKLKAMYQADIIQSSYEVFEFSEWLSVNFGIKLTFDKDGNVLRDYIITDEKKYIF